MPQHIHPLPAGDIRDIPLTTKNIVARGVNSGHGQYIRYVQVRIHLNWQRKGIVRQELQYVTLGVCPTAHSTHVTTRREG